jgi:hypothetical protein
MALEEPEIRMDVELRHDLAEAVGAAVGGDAGDAVHHQHRRQRRARPVLAEQLAPARLQQFLVAVRALGHVPAPAVGFAGAILCSKTDRIISCAAS